MITEEVVTTPQKYCRRDNDEEEGEPPKLHTPEEFIDAFKKSKYYSHVVDEINTQQALLKEGLVLHLSPFPFNTIANSVIFRPLLHWSEPSSDDNGSASVFDDGDFEEDKSQDDDEEIPDNNGGSSNSSTGTKSEEEEIDLSDYEKKKKYPISIFDQYLLLQKREFIATWRMKNENLLRIFKSLCITFMICTLFFELSHSTVHIILLLSSFESNSFF